MLRGAGDKIDLPNDTSMQRSHVDSGRFGSAKVDVSGLSFVMPPVGTATSHCTYLIRLITSFAKSFESS